MNQKWASFTICFSRSARRICARASTSLPPPVPTPASFLPTEAANMKGDYSRDTFDPAKHFSRVLMQQGRVQLDADWNEQGAILLHYLQTLAADLIGSYGGPLDHLGFEIKPVPATDPTKLTDLSIGFGRYYVDGILCENPEEAANVVRSPRVRTEAAPKNHTEPSGTAAQSQPT